MKSKIYEGSHYIQFKNAWWGPISCESHSEYKDYCDTCKELRHNTRTHILAATEDVPW